MVLLIPLPMAVLGRDHSPQEKSKRRAKEEDIIPT